MSSDQCGYFAPLGLASSRNLASMMVNVGKVEAKSKLKFHQIWVSDGGCG